MNNGRKTIYKIQAILFAVFLQPLLLPAVKTNDNNKADENGFTAEQRTVLCDAARAFYLLDFDYNSKVTQYPSVSLRNLPSMFMPTATVLKQPLPTTAAIAPLTVKKLTIS